MNRKNVRSAALRVVVLAAATASAACAPRLVPPEPFPVIVMPREPDVAPVLPPELPSEPYELARRPPVPSPFPEGVDPGVFQMHVDYNDHVAFYLDFFTGRARSSFEQWLRRQGRFEDIILDGLAEHGLPAELLYLPLVESGYSPVAVSRAGAVGLWQFMPATGRMEGLEVSDIIDERRDPVRATDAALQHLRRLHDRYDSWYLALAAYNAGPGRIDRALRDHLDGASGHDSLFWAVRHALPAETRNYVPQFLAASIIGRNRAAFGFDAVPGDPPATFDVATIPDATELAVIAEVAGVPLPTIRELNAHFTAGVTPGGRSSEIRLPTGSAEGFIAAYAALPPSQRVRTRVHVVARGETLSAIAARYGATVRAIQNANGISQPNRIGIGQRLVIPVGGAAVAAAAAAAAPRPAGAVASNASAPPAAAAPASGRAAEYTVQPGDNLTRIASRHNISLPDLLALNGLSANAVIRPGQNLRLQPPVTVYVVQPGDTLIAIARRHGVSAADLRGWNAIAGDLIRPGDRLEVRTP